jgi:hypothetical protein
VKGDLFLVFQHFYLDLRTEAPQTLQVREKKRKEKKRKEGMPTSATGTTATNVITLVLALILIGLIIFAMYRRFHPSPYPLPPPSRPPKGAPPFHVQPIPPMPIAPGVPGAPGAPGMPGMPSMPSIPVGPEVPAIRPCKPCPTCPECPSGNCPVCPSCPTVECPSCNEPSAPSTPTENQQPISLWPVLPSDISPGSLGGTLTLECSDVKKSISPSQIPQCFSAGDYRISCRTKVDQSDPNPQSFLQKGKNPSYPSFKNDSTPFSSPTTDIRGPTRIIIHYFYLTSCPACQVFRREIWEPLLLEMKNQPIMFHEVNASMYDGKLQAQKHQISLFPTLTWNKIGVNQPHYHLQTGGGNKQELTNKIQLILQQV